MASIITIDCAQPPREVLRVGLQGEQYARSARIDLSAWRRSYGADGAATVLVQRPGDMEPYAVIPEVQADGSAVWRLSRTDTAQSGRGFMQVVFIAGETIKKTPILAVEFGPSLGEAGEPAEPYEGFLERVTELAAQAVQNAGIAQESANAAEGSAHDAAESADTAERWAELAQEGAANAGYFYLEGRDDGHLYMIRSANAPPDISFRDNNGRLVAVYA